LFPVFLKLEELEVLLVGGGKVGLEKLTAIVTNAPATSVLVVASEISEPVKQLAEKNLSIRLLEKPFEPDDLEDKDIVIVAVNDKSVSNYVRVLAKERKLLVNVADTPDLCDFYLGSIVDKGNLKIAISTNGKSPTIAKRMREQLNELIPDEIESVLQNMHSIRQDLRGDFAEKVRQLDDLTKVLSAKQAKLDQLSKPGGKKWQGIVKWSLFAFFFMLFGHGLLSFVPFHKISEGIQKIPQYIDTPTF
jgi:siroheme synthase-like protein